MNTILASAVSFSFPFIDSATTLSLYTKQLIEAKPPKILDINFSKCDLGTFLANFYTYTIVFIEAISLYFAETIRRSSTRSDMRVKTTDSLAEMIRTESFRNTDDILVTYVVTMGQLGIQLETTSTVRSAIEGGIVGGLLDGGRSNTLGTFAGAVIGAAFAHIEKQRIRQDLITTAIDGIYQFVDSLPPLSQKLMDQYASYIYGENIDFDQRDQQILRFTPILKNIASYCKSITQHMIALNDAVPVCEMYAVQKIGPLQLVSLSSEGKKKYQHALTSNLKKQGKDSLLNFHKDVLAPFKGKSNLAEEYSNKLTELRKYLDQTQAIIQKFEGIKTQIPNIDQFKMQAL